MLHAKVDWLQCLNTGSVNFLKLGGLDSPKVVLKIVLVSIYILVDFHIDLSRVCREFIISSVFGCKLLPLVSKKQPKDN